MFYNSQQHRFIYGVIQSPEEVLADPQFESRGYFVEVDHPTIGPLRYPGAPFNMEGTPWQIKGPAPGLGQHNQEVLGERLGYSNAELAGLRAEGTI